MSWSLILPRNLLPRTLFRLTRNENARGVLITGLASLTIALQGYLLYHSIHFRG